MSPPSGAPRSDLSLMTQDQMQANRFNNVYDAVEALHGNWLQARRPDSFTQPTEVRVYFNSTMLGGVSTLRDIATNSVTYVRYFDGVAATGRWGLGHGAGGIYVSTHPPGTDP